MSRLQSISDPLGGLTTQYLRAGVVSPLYQPIVVIGQGMSHLTIAVEALSRGPSGTPLESPLALFDAARRSDVVGPLDRLCIETALGEARRLPKHLVVFLNVHPATLCDDCEFPAFLAEAANRNGIEPTRLALEVLERARVNDSQCRQLLGSLQVLRGLGIRLAVDDVSGVQDDIRRALALRPEYLKVDAAVVHGARCDMKVRALLHAIAELAAGTGAQVIAEGIETADDLEIVAAAGIELAQGYLLGRPVAAEVLNHMTTRLGETL
jgi:EAL domain-containing protein (putative c-di-GMP-specific phosphodiesterase class I)